MGINSPRKQGNCEKCGAILYGDEYGPCGHKCVELLQLVSGEDLIKEAERWAFLNSVDEKGPTGGEPNASTPSYRLIKHLKQFIQTKSNPPETNKTEALGGVRLEEPENLLSCLLEKFWSKRVRLFEFCGSIEIWAVELKDIDEILLSSIKKPEPLIAEAKDIIEKHRKGFEYLAKK